MTRSVILSAFALLLAAAPASAAPPVISTPVGARSFTRTPIVRIMARATHIAAIAGHTGDGIAGTITGIGTTDLCRVRKCRLSSVRRCPALC